MANDRQEALLETTEVPKEPGPGAHNAVAVSDLCPGTTAMPTSDSPMGAAQDNIVDKAQLAYEELSDLELGPSSPKRFPTLNLPMPHSPKLGPSTGSAMLERYRRHIESLGQPIYREFTSVGEPFLRSLEEAGRRSSGPRAVLARLTKIAHKEFDQQRRSDFMEDDPELERETEQEDGSGEEYSRNLLECVRRMIVVEASIWQSSSNRSQVGKNRRKMAGEIPPGGHLGIREVPGEEISITTDLDVEGNDPEDESAKYKEKQDGGNVSLQCCSDMAR